MRSDNAKLKYEGRIVDIHSHVLPGVDDGATSFEQSMSMLNISISEGIAAIAATPHIVCDGSEKLYVARIQKAYETLKALAEENRLPIKVRLGYEVLLSRSLLHIYNIHQYVIEGTNWILVEPHLSEPPRELDELLYQLEHDGIGLILAHPERNKWLARNTAYLHELTGRGVLMQVNAGSITGYWGRDVARAARKFAGEGLIHLIGSDAHSDSARGPGIRDALAMLSGWIGDGQVEIIACKLPEMMFNQKSTDTGEEYAVPKMQNS